MDQNGITVDITLDAGDGASAEELDELTAALRRELLRLDVESVDRPSGGPAPADARGPEIAMLGALIVELGKVGPNSRTGRGGHPSLGSEVAGAHGQADDR